MERDQPTVRTAIKRAHAETHLLVSLTAFAISVIATRLFLELTGYPQLGDGVLHIAHALWGGLLLLAAVLLPLVAANRWARTWSAVLSGLGVGLFIDEIGKFITQKNDYFFPPAAPVIYAVFLLLVLLFLFVRSVGKPSPRAEMYRALTSLGELLDNNLDPRELERLLARLNVARQADQPHVAGLATTLHTYLQETDIPLVPARPSIWRRLMATLERWGKRLGRRGHRIVIVLAMLILALGMVAAVAVPFLGVVAPETAGQRFLAWQMARADVQSSGSDFWFYARLLLEGLVGFIALGAIFFFVWHSERQAIHAALLSLMLSLTGVLLLSFYLDQFSATIMALLQFGVLLLVLAYRRWYLSDEMGFDA
ncbi:hypothetical protein ACFLYD_05730 [Chloroflexota bacterium]